jgi:predicted dehydrogenase
MALPRSRSLNLQGYANELAAFAEAIRGNRFDGAPYIADAWKSLRLAWALHQSHGKTVRPEDF